MSSMTGTTLGANELTLNAGELLLIDPYELHSANFDRDDDLLAASIISRFMSRIFSGVGLCESESCRDIEFISRVNEYIDRNYGDSNITTASVSAALGYSKGYFCALFRKNFEMTFSNYLTDYRLGAAMTDYRNSPLRLSEIAEQVGFGDYCYFSRCFHRKTGVSPTEYFRNPAR